MCIRDRSVYGRSTAGMIRSPIWTCGLIAWPGEAQETTMDVAGSFPQVRWICSGVPAPDAATCVAATAGTAVAAVARRLAPPTVSMCRRDRPLAAVLSGFSGMSLTFAPDGEHRATPRKVLARKRMNSFCRHRAHQALSARQLAVTTTAYFLLDAGQRVRALRAVHPGGTRPAHRGGPGRTPGRRAAREPGDGPQ